MDRSPRKILGCNEGPCEDQSAKEARKGKPLKTLIIRRHPCRNPKQIIENRRNRKPRDLSCALPADPGNFCLTSPDGKADPRAVQPKPLRFKGDIYIYIYVYIYICRSHFFMTIEKICVCVYVCMHACMYVCMYVCVYYIYIYIYFFSSGLRSIPPCDKFAHPDKVYKPRQSL